MQKPWFHVDFPLNCSIHRAERALLLRFPDLLEESSKSTDDFPLGYIHWKYYTCFLVGGFNPSEKYESQLGLLFPTEWEKHVPNHQPFLKPVLIHLQWISWPPNDVRRRCSYCHQRESRMGGWSWPLQTASFRTCEDVIFWVFLQVPSLNDPIWYVFLFFSVSFGSHMSFWSNELMNSHMFSDFTRWCWRFGTRTTLTNTYIHDDCHLILQWILIMC